MDEKFWEYGKNICPDPTYKKNLKTFKDVISKKEGSEKWTIDQNHLKKFL